MLNSSADAYCSSLERWLALGRYEGFSRACPNVLSVNTKARKRSEDHSLLVLVVGAEPTPYPGVLRDRGLFSTVVLGSGSDNHNEGSLPVCTWIA